MKKIFFMLTIASTIVACKQNTQPETIIVETTTEQVAPKEILAANLVTKTFTVEGMTCAKGCAASIQRKLAKTEGVKEANVDFETKTAVIEYDKTQLDEAKIKQIVEAVGDGTIYKTVGL